MDTRETNITTTLEGIQKAKGDELSLIVHAIIGRYAELFPDWEITFLSLPKDPPDERQRTLEAAFNFWGRQAMK